MNSIFRGLVFDKQARVAIIDTTELLQDLDRIHKFSPIAKKAMGRAISIGGYISCNIKNPRGRFNIIIDGDGALGKIYVAGESKGKIKGYIENPSVGALPYTSINNLNDAVGRTGFFTVIKDLGIIEPYVGKTEIVSGNISDDFAWYLFSSEGIKSVVGLDVFNYNGKLYSLGIICEVMPNASDETIFILEDIISRFSEISIRIAEFGVIDTFNFYFGHFGSDSLSVDTLEFFCNCQSRADNIIKSIGEDEIANMLQEKETVELCCDYCGKKTSYGLEKLSDIFRRKF